MPRALTALLPMVVAAPVLVACSPSPVDLASEVAQAPGVIEVDAHDANDGDNDIPFAQPPLAVRVRMDRDATADEAMAVFDAYDEEIDDGDVSLVEVTLDGPTEATMSAGEGIHVTREAVADLIDAQHDPQIGGYRREAYPVLPSVTLILTVGGFAEVAAAADRYRDVEDLQLVTVKSGNFTLIRDEMNEDLSVTSARERLVHRVESRFALSGASVSGRSPVRLWVAPMDVDAVQNLAARNPETAKVGKVVVRPEVTG